MATKQGFLRNLRDAALLVTFAGPTGHGATGATGVKSSAAVDLDALTAQGERPWGLELVLRCPLLTGGATGQFPDAETLALSIEADDTTGFTGPTSLGTVTLTGSTGAAANELRVGVASNTKRYVRGKVVLTGTDVSSATFDFGVVT